MEAPSLANGRGIGDCGTGWEADGRPENAPNRADRKSSALAVEAEPAITTAATIPRARRLPDSEIMSASAVRVDGPVDSVDRRSGKVHRLAIRARRGHGLRRGRHHAGRQRAAGFEPRRA